MLNKIFNNEDNSYYGMEFFINKYLENLKFKDTEIEKSIINDIKHDLENYKLKDITFELVATRSLANIKKYMLIAYPSLSSDDIVIECFNNEFDIYLDKVDIANIIDFNITYFLYGMRKKEFREKYEKLISYKDGNTINKIVELLDKNIFYSTVEDLLDYIIDTLSKESVR